MNTDINRELQGQAIRIGVGIMSFIASGFGVMATCVSIALGLSAAAMAAVIIGAMFGGFVFGAFVMASASLAAADMHKASSMAAHDSDIVTIIDGTVTP